MTNSIDLERNQLLAVSRSALGALRGALLRDVGHGAATSLQEAGYAGGEAVFATFREWAAARGIGEPEELAPEQFQEEAAAFFREAGWGTLQIGSLHDAVATVDSPDWGEADPASGMETPSCHLTTGMFADFFGRLSNTPLAVMEVECRSSGAGRCRFLLGNADVMAFIYEAMAAGQSYEEAAAQVE